MTYKVISGALGAAALLGWSLYAHTLSSLNTRESALRQEISRLQRERDQYAADRLRMTEEHDQLRQRSGELDEVQKQLASVREQLKSLDQARVRLTESIAQARSQLTSVFEPSPGGNPPVRAVTPSPSNTPMAHVRSAQEALIRLGYGPLEVDGRVGPGTRRAIEAFERAQGLAITGDLQSETVQALERESGVSIQ
jgi:hypothetical protein